MTTLSFAQTRKFGLIKDPASYSAHIRPNVLNTVPGASGVVPPSSWDWRTYGIVTPSKDQGLCGSCWAFSTAAIMESKILLAGGVTMDLSEQRIQSCGLPASTDNCNDGQTLVNALRYWSNNLPSTEACNPYLQRHSTCPTVPTSGSCVPGFTHGTGVYTISPTTFETDLKTSVYADGPAGLSFRVFQDFLTFWENKSNSGKVYTNASNQDPLIDNLGNRGASYHMVTVIGWDDTKKAYLVKNSWEGATGGPNSNGTVWIAYSGHKTSLEFGAGNYRYTGTTFENTAYTFFYGDIVQNIGKTEIGKNNIHWLQNGYSEYRYGTPGFHAVSYLSYYNDLSVAFGDGRTAASAKNALNHWVSNGLMEGRAASPVFDPKYYLAANTALGGFDLAYDDWIRFGLSTGKRGSRAFDPKYYLANNPDIAAAFGATNYLGAIQHFMVWGGMREGRRTAADFDIKAYVNRYPDLKAFQAKNFGSDYSWMFYHWIRFGQYEGRNPAP